MVKFCWWLPKLQGGVRRAHFHCASVLPPALLFLPAFTGFVSLSAFPSQLPAAFFPSAPLAALPVSPWEPSRVFGCFCVAGNAVAALTTGAGLFRRPLLSHSGLSQNAALSVSLLHLTLSGFGRNWPGSEIRTSLQ